MIRHGFLTHRTKRVEVSKRTGWACLFPQIVQDGLYKDEMGILGRGNPKKRKACR